MSSRRSNLILVGLIVLALVGVALLTVPSSPFHRGVKKGLDLQGGLEVVLKAEPPKGHKLDKSDLDRSVNIMRNRVDKLGVASPEIREQSPDQIVIQLAGVHDPEQAAQIVGSTAQLELYDLTPALVSPSVDAAGDAAAAVRESLRPAEPAVQSKATTGTPTGYVLFKPVKVTTGTGKKKKTTTVFVVAHGTANNGQAATLHRDPSTGNAGLLDSHGGKVPPGWKVLKVPPKTVVVTCDSTSSSICPAQNQGALPPPGNTFYYLFKHGAYPSDRFATDGKYPNMTGKDLKASGVRADFDQNGNPIVLLAFSHKGNRIFKQVTKNEAQRGQIAGGDLELRRHVRVRDRARQRDPLVPDDRPVAEPAGDRSDAEPARRSRSATSRTRSPSRSSWRSCCRRARCRCSSRRSSRPTSRRRSARTR